MVKERRFLTAVIALGFLALCFLLIPKQEGSKKLAPKKNERSGVLESITAIGPKNHDEQAEAQKAKMVNLLNNPISFWGKVVDQNGNPVVGAHVEISVTNKFSWSPSAQNSSTTFKRNTDSRGLFALLKQRGGSINVRVSADNYAPSFNEKTEKDQSRVTLSYAGKNDSLHHSRPTKNEPMIFVLRKKNPPANLIRFPKKVISINLDGEPTTIVLNSQNINFEVEVRCWSSCPEPFTYDKYDWKAEIKVTRGLIKVVDELDPVLAPENGYSSSFAFEMPKNTEQNWQRTSPSGTRDFWIKFENGNYARSRIEIITGRKHQIVVEASYNLDGTNNFEQ